ncbi:TPA: winged helix-turn-helix domain-containing protein [Methanosarcinaceae archaeon]|nr:winged helix-turn-helix domain-containing protein [Methanosarcinaceae archaeon]
MGPSRTDLAILTETKRNILLLLKDKPGNIGEIKDLLSLSKASAVAHVRRLEKTGLLIEDKGIFRLSDMGAVLVGRLKELLDVLGFFEQNRDYWKNHDLRLIPTCLLNTINELGNCELIEPDVTHMFEVPQVFQKDIRNSKEVLAFISYFHPQTPPLYAHLAERDIDLSLCMTRDIFKRYSSNFPEEIKRILAARNSRLFICHENSTLPEVVATDRFMALRLLEHDGRLRNQLMMSHDAEALRWGRELYNHYENMSEEVNPVRLKK